MAAGDTTACITPNIKAGQIFQRKRNDGSGLVGLVFFDDFIPVESHSYVAMFQNPLSKEVAATIFAKSVCSDKPDLYDVSRVNELIKMPIWNKTTMPCTGTVRFIPAIDEQNGFIIYGASPQCFFNTSKDDAWLKISDGQYHEYRPDIQTGGETLSCVLRKPIWQDLNGDEYALFDGSTRFNETIYVYHRLLIRFYRKEISLNDYQNILDANPDIKEAFPSTTFDPGFLRYLSELEERGLLRKPGPAHKSEDELLQNAIANCTKAIFQDTQFEDELKP